MMKDKSTEFDSKSKDELGRRLDNLNSRMGRDVKGNKLESTKHSDSAGYSNAMRMSSEFIAAILVGFAIGFGIDWLTGTKPWAMIFFLLLGFVAGVMNVMRVAGETSGPYQVGKTNVILDDDEDD